MNEILQKHWQWWQCESKRLENLTRAWSSVWPDVGIKIGPKLDKRVTLAVFASKIAKILWATFVRILFIKIAIHLGYFCKKFGHQEIYKIRQYYHTAISGHDAKSQPQHISLPWSSGYGRRLTFRRSWVWIPAPYTGWTWHFSHWFFVKICIVCLKRPKIKEKRGHGWPIFLKKVGFHWNSMFSKWYEVCCAEKTFSTFNWYLPQSALPRYAKNWTLMN